MVAGLPTMKNIRTSESVPDAQASVLTDITPMNRALILTPTQPPFHQRNGTLRWSDAPVCSAIRVLPALTGPGPQASGIFPQSLTRFDKTGRPNPSDSVILAISTRYAYRGREGKGDNAPE
jgi:hypothetical protein